MMDAFLLSALAIIKRTSSIDVRLKSYKLNNKNGSIISVGVLT